MSNILLIDVDSKIPNLALMKLSAYHKSKGDKVALVTLGENIGNIEKDIIPDKIYASVIFKKNKHMVDGLSFYYPDVEIDIGGSGYDLNKKLPDEIDLLKPDYDLYANTNNNWGNSNIGYTSRGCDINCYFCVVPKKEGKFKIHQHPSQFYDVRFKKIIFLDNNILWDKEWFREVMNFCIYNRLEIWFTQGLDIRLIDENDIMLLKKVKKYETVTFAWDDIKLEKIVRKKVQMLKDCKYAMTHVRFFVYIDSDEQFESGLFRCNELKKMGVNAYVMLNQDNPITDRMRKLKNWVNDSRSIWKYSFEEFCKERGCRNIDLNDKCQKDIISAWS